MPTCSLVQHAKSLKTQKHAILSIFRHTTYSTSGSEPNNTLKVCKMYRYRLRVANIQNHPISSSSYFKVGISRRRLKLVKVTNWTLSNFPYRLHVAFILCMQQLICLFRYPSFSVSTKYAQKQRYELVLLQSVIAFHACDMPP